MEIFICILAAAAAVAFSLFSLIFSNGGLAWKWKKNLPPSPPSLPILGHCYLLSLPTHRSLAAIARRYGPLLYLQLGSRPVLLVSSSSAAQECLSNNDIVFANRPQTMVGKYIGYNHTMILLANYGPHWRNLRRISTSEFLSQQRIKMLSATRKEEIRSLVKRLFQGYSGEGKRVVELKSKFSELMFNVILGDITGKQYHGEDMVDKEEGRKFGRLIQEVMLLLGVSNYLDFFPVLAWMDFGRVQKRMAKVRDELDQCLQNLIDKYQRKSKKHDSSSSKDEETRKKMIKTLIDVLLSLKQTEPEYYTDDIIKGLIVVHSLSFSCKE